MVETVINSKCMTVGNHQILKLRMTKEIIYSYRDWIEDNTEYVA